MVKTLSKKAVQGIWDLNIAPISLGGLLTLAEELKIKSIEQQAELADLCLVGDVTSLNILESDGKINYQKHPRLSAFMMLEGIGSCYLLESIAQQPETDCTRKYDTTLFVQEFYKKNEYIPQLSCKTGPLTWALRFLKNNVFPAKPIVIHLKNNPNGKGLSNAKLKVWLSFFGQCVGRKDLKFILIGNEEIGPEIVSLPNILVARDFGSTLVNDLALIQTAYIFLGMSSGPCNMAIFSPIPYVIFKNPGHHVEEMKIELGQADKFPFASVHHKFYRVFETKEKLISELGQLHNSTNEEAWQQRLALIGVE